MSEKDMFQLTAKGEEEVKQRTYKLDPKRRSLLILLNKEQSLEYLRQKTVLPLEAFHLELDVLITQGFIVSSQSVATSPRLASSRGANTPREDAAKARPSDVFHVADGIILSEAKFLLTDFCVDCFGTRSEASVADIRACKDTHAFRNCLEQIIANAKTQCPARLGDLTAVIKEINETAD
ncbi:MAG: hypothetical protein PHF20_02495 [Halothiobacillaceae bacterium]|nr:hypothetical protein [Halothiobacillaceae bacterium]